jgi:hypothetical protein
MEPWTLNVCPHSCAGINLINNIRVIMYKIYEYHLESQSKGLASVLPCAHYIRMQPIFSCKDKWHNPLWESCLALHGNNISDSGWEFPAKQIHCVFNFHQFYPSIMYARIYEIITDNECISSLLTKRCTIPALWLHGAVPLSFQQQAKRLTSRRVHKWIGLPLPWSPSSCHRQ